MQLWKKPEHGGKQGQTELRISIGIFRDIGRRIKGEGYWMKD
jgi:hypothetical protein